MTLGLCLETVHRAKSVRWLFAHIKEEKCLSKYSTLISSELRKPVRKTSRLCDDKMMQLHIKWEDDDPTRSDP